MIGKKVRVFWPVDGSWYTGVVLQHDASTGEHLLKYEDEDTEWVKIGESNTNAAQTPVDGGHLSSSEGPPLPNDEAASMDGPSHASTTAADQLADHQRRIMKGEIPSHRQHQNNPHQHQQHQYHPQSLRSQSSFPPPNHPSLGAAGRTTPDRGQWPMEQQQQQHGHPDPGHPSYGMYPPGGGGPGPGGAYGMLPGPQGGPGSFPPGGYHPHHPHTMASGPYGPPSPYGYPGGMTMTMNMPPSMIGSGGPDDQHHHNSSMHHPQHPAKSPSEPSSSPTSMSGGGSKRKAGPKAWTKEEDAKLLSIVQSMRMPMKWSIVAQSLQERTGKQCRERYVNHLNPRLKVTDWSPVEDATIFYFYNISGSHWAKMSRGIPGRTDNGIKNRFHNLRRQLEREDEHRLRLSTAENFPEEIRLDRIRDFPANLQGKASELWDMKNGIGVLAAQSVLGGSVSRNSSRFGPFRKARDGDLCVRCGMMMPSLHTGTELCTKSGWCQSCTRIPPHICNNLLRECLNLRREQDTKVRDVIETWKDYYGVGAVEAAEASKVEAAA